MYHLKGTYFIEVGDKMRLAIFDFDGTLYEKETFNILMEHLETHPLYQNKYKRFYWKIVPPVLANKLRILSTKKMRIKSMQAYIDALDRLTKEELTAYFSDMAKKMRPHFNQAVIDKFKAHKKEGYKLMLVSGAFTELLEQFKTELPFDLIIGTNIPILQGEVNKTEAVEHIHGETKTEKIFEALRNETVDWEASYAYADSYSDLAVLELVGHPVAVDPDDELRSHANQLGWEVIEKEEVINE